MKINKGLRTTQEKGQSLVEMAIIAPILIFFLLGIFEVGWALRNYLVLVNTNREITRFAIRPGYLNFSTQANVTGSYQRVKDWMDNTTSGQLEFDFDETTGATTLIISHLVIDTGKPCKPDALVPCNCNWFDPNHSDYDPDNPNVLKEDDIIIHPGMENYGYQSVTYGPITTTHNEVRETRQDYEALAEKLADQNNQFNCELIKRNGIPSANNVVITELFHDQPQLFGFPILSNPFTDPVHLYTHTVMRLTGGARSSGGAGGSLIASIDTVGEVCFAHPFIVSEAQIGGDFPPPPSLEGSSITILSDDPLGPSSHKGWVVWDPDNGDEVLKYQIQFPQMSVNGYENPNDPSDTVLNQDDGVRALTGSHMNNVRQYVEAWIGKEIIVPVYDPNVSPDGNDNYFVTGFIKVIIQDVTGNQVNALLVGAAPEACNTAPSS